MIPEIKESSDLDEFLNSIIQERTGTKRDITEELHQHLSSCPDLEKTYEPISQFVIDSKISENIRQYNTGILIEKAVKDFYSRNGREDLVNRLEYDVLQSSLGGEIFPSTERDISYIARKGKGGPIRAYVPSSR